LSAFFGRFAEKWVFMVTRHGAPVTAFGVAGRFAGRSLGLRVRTN